jgi:hypothetical protein
MPAVITNRFYENVVYQDMKTGFISQNDVQRFVLQVRYLRIQGAAS